MKGSKSKFVEDKHDNSIVFQINDLDSRKRIVQELLGRKYVISYNKKNKLQLNFKNY